MNGEIAFNWHCPVCGADNADSLHRDLGPYVIFRCRSCPNTSGYSQLNAASRASHSAAVATVNQKRRNT